MEVQRAVDGVLELGIRRQPDISCEVPQGKGISSLRKGKCGKFTTEPWRMRGWVVGGMTRGGSGR